MVGSHLGGLGIFILWETVQQTVLKCIFILWLFGPTIQVISRNDLFYTVKNLKLGSHQEHSFSEKNIFELGQDKQFVCIIFGFPSGTFTEKLKKFILNIVKLTCKKYIEL